MRSLLVLITCFISMAASAKTNNSVIINFGYKGIADIEHEALFYGHKLDYDSVRIYANLVILDENSNPVRSYPIYIETRSAGLQAFYMRHLLNEQLNVKNVKGKQVSSIFGTYYGADLNLAVALGLQAGAAINSQGVVLRNLSFVYGGFGAGTAIQQVTISPNLNQADISIFTDIIE